LRSVIYHQHTPHLPIHPIQRTEELLPRDGLDQVIIGAQRQPSPGPVEQGADDQGKVVGCVPQKGPTIPFPIRARAGDDSPRAVFLDQPQGFSLVMGFNRPVAFDVALQ